MSPTSNSQIADALDELGDLYELDGAVIHRVVAYRTAAKAIRDSPVSVEALTREGRVKEIAGIGATLEQKIRDLIDTGDIPAAVKLRSRFPPGLLAITALPNLGPKRARRLYEELGIDSMKALREAAEAQRLRELRGFGAKFEESVLAALDAGAGDGEHPARRVVLDRALAVGELVIDALQTLAPEARIELAGSARRRADSVKDLDIVLDSPALLDQLQGLELIESASRTSASAARARTHSGLTVELRAVAPEQFGDLLQHLTGSAAHNAALREWAVRRGLHISEYGVLDDSSGETATFATEEELYGHLGLPYIEPELRENRGELEAARAGELPVLIEESDIRGDLHCHTTASDGTASIEEMALAGRDRGYEYLAITDHSATHGFGDEVSPDALRRQIELVREADASIKGMRLLAGSEVNILPDGRLDYDDELLAELDWVIASVHTSFGIDADAMTKRVIAAVEHPLVHAIGHLSGRLIERRHPYALDTDAVFAACARTGTLIEINSSPNRRDLNEVNARAAAAAGVGLLINTDSHRTDGFDVLRFGVWTARRAWLRKEQVLNTLSWAKLSKRLKQR
ncbi:MAG TPA: DNA polymerase/3'-5' exonuclease PolX [Solirubrobacteraceae bacterium]|nr:DNA polymerase/3'-5' exonuclease PolX [Solirubrobacteraceae bacterium]